MENGTGGVPEKPMKCQRACFERQRKRTRGRHMLQFAALRPETRAIFAYEPGRHYGRIASPSLHLSARLGTIPKDEDGCVWLARFVP
jgi:hypothetical protein